MSSFRQIEQCGHLYKEILDLFHEENVSGVRSGTASL